MYKYNILHVKYVLSGSKFNLNEIEIRLSNLQFCSHRNGLKSDILDNSHGF